MGRGYCGRQDMIVPRIDLESETGSVVQAMACLK